MRKGLRLTLGAVVALLLIPAISFAAAPVFQTIPGAIHIGGTGDAPNPIFTGTFHLDSAVVDPDTGML
jgi:hypothetical protein